MTTQRRPASPTGPRIYLEPPRASTGNMLTSSYETRYDQRAPRASSGSILSSQIPSSRNNSIYETQPVSKRIYNDSTNPGATISKTEYAVRPRRNSMAAENRRPLTVMTKHVSPTVEYFESPRDMAPYKQTREEPSRLLAPAQPRPSAHHQRHNSATRAETGRYFAHPTTPRLEREYHKRGPYVEKVAESRPVMSLVRYEEPTYEYTGPREQFDRDFPAHAPTSTRSRRESLTRRERPSSATGSKFENVPFRRDTAPAPSAPRQLHRVDRDDRRSGFDSDPDRPRESHRSRASHHGPVVHQREDGYSSSRDDYDSRRALKPRPHQDEMVVAGSKSRYRNIHPDTDRERERHRREYDRDSDRPSERDRDRERHERRQPKPHDREYDRERERLRPREYEIIEGDDSQRRSRRRDTRGDRDQSPEHSGLKNLATAALGGLAAAGIAGHKPRKDKNESDSDSRKGHRRHRRHRSADRAQEERHDDDLEHRRRSRAERRDNHHESSGSDTPEDDANRRRPQSRTRQRQGTLNGYSSEPERSSAGLAAQQPDRYPAREMAPAEARRDSSRDPALERAKQDSPTTAEGKTLSSGEGEGGRPRKVSIVEPVKDQKPEFKPKSILKPPREVPFPEDPNPTREGVAPLKQAGKDGIPNGARWTKISRILVNPEALERAQERFEERDDYVIVLRVVSREEIEKLAEKTREIREAREREWQKQVEERKRKLAERGEYDNEEEDDFDDDDGPNQQLALEPPPSAPPADLRHLAQQNSIQPQMAYAPHQGYAPQQLPQQQEWQQPQQPQQQTQQQWQPQQWTGQPLYQQQQQPPQWGGVGPGSARSSAERIANTAPGQPVPGSGQRQQQVDTNTYGPVI